MRLLKHQKPGKYHVFSTTKYGINDTLSPKSLYQESLCQIKSGIDRGGATCRTSNRLDRQLINLLLIEKYITSWRKTPQKLKYTVACHLRRGFANSMAWGQYNGTGKVGSLQPGGLHSWSARGSLMISSWQLSPGANECTRAMTGQGRFPLTLTCRRLKLWDPNYWIDPINPIHYI